MPGTSGFLPLFSGSDATYACGSVSSRLDAVPGKRHQKRSVVERHSGGDDALSLVTQVITRWRNYAQHHGVTIEKEVIDVETAARAGRTRAAT